MGILDRFGHDTQFSLNSQIVREQHDHVLKPDLTLESQKSGSQHRRVCKAVRHSQSIQ